MGRILGVILCLGVVTTLGCYTAPHPDCGFICGQGGACPADYTCAADNYCHLNGTPASLHCSIDAGIPDAPPDGPPAPMVVTTTPPNGATNVSRSADVTATFDRPVVNIGASTVIVTQINQATVPLPGTVTYDDASRTATFTPSPPLPAGVAIIVQLLSSQIKSVDGVPLAPFSLAFSTIDDQAPTLASSTPMDMDVNVPVNTTITVVFSETVTNVSATSFTVAQGATPIIGTIAGDGITFTFTPSADLPAGSVITVDLTGVIADLAGNPLVPVQFTFTTQ